MEYPFKFKELLLTEDLVRAIGFTDWWGSSGEGSEIGFELDPATNTSPVRYRLRSSAEDSGGTYGPEYESAHIQSYVDFKPLYFLHDLYEDIVSHAVDEDQVFLLTRLISYSTKYALNSYLNYKHQM